MPKVALAFFTVAPVYGLIGMLWGMQMGSSGDHSMSPAHAHLNLLGLVLNGLMGSFYAFAGARVSTRLAWVNFVLSNLAVVLMTPALAIILTGDERVLPVMIVAEICAVLGVVAFLASTLTMWRRAPA